MSTKYNHPEVIFTWRNLRIAREPPEFIEICWDWPGWDHAANDRQHILEGKRLWLMVYDESVIEPLIKALGKQKLKDCHSDLQRLAGMWRDEFVRVLGLPRLLRTRSIDKKRPSSAGTVARIFISAQGIVFIARHFGKNRYWLSTFYFAECLVNGLAFAPKMFERNAVEQYADLYSKCSEGKLPSRNNRRHFVTRKWEVDRQIKFINAVQWGFESENPGADWIGFPETEVVDEPFNLAPVDPPPVCARKDVEIS